MKSVNEMVKMELQEWLYYEFSEYGTDDVELNPEEIGEIKECYKEFKRIQNFINKKIIR